MPIKGLTDRSAAFPRIGVLRKGDKKVSENKPGKDLTYFRFVTEDESATADFLDSYGAKPRAINIALPYATPQENWSAWREEWIQGGLVHRCDGETCVVHKLPDGSYSTTPKPCPGGCKPVGRLSVIIPEFRRLALVTVLTTSLHDIIAITENVEALNLIRNDLRGIPMLLLRKPRMVSVPEVHPKGHPQQYKPTGRRVRREKWLLTIEAEPQYVRLQLAAQQAAAMPMLSAPQAPELMAPEEEESNGQEEAGEFGPMMIDPSTGEILDSPFTEPDEYADFVDAEDPGFSESESEPDPDPAPAPDTSGRPYTAEQIRATCRQRSKWFDGDKGPLTRRNVAMGPIDDKRKPIIAQLITGALPNLSATLAETARHDILDYLFTVQSTTKLTDAEARTVIDWLKAKDSWQPGPYAQAEIARVLTAAAVERGQMELPL